MSELQMLPAWLESGAVPAATLKDALPGVAQAQEMTPLRRLQRLQESGLAECGAAGEPIYLAWRQFLRGHGPSVLVIDATSLDLRSRGTTAVLDGAPWLLAEGVLIAAGLRDSRKVEAAPAVRVDRPRCGSLECGRFNPFARTGCRSSHTAGSAAQLPPKLLV